MERLIKSTFLVCGTAIGTGILALPFSSPAAGFYPSILILIIAGIFMTIAAFYMLYSTVHFTKDSDLITIAERSLGVFAKIITWITYLLLLYSLTGMYIIVGSAWFKKFFYKITTYNISTYYYNAIFTIFSATLIFYGIRAVGVFNKYITFALLLSLALIIVLGAQDINISNLDFRSTNNIFSSLPMILTAFGFSIVVPALSSYTNKDLKLLSKSIYIGSIITITLYIAWDAIGFGIVGVDGEDGLINIAKHDDQGTILIEKIQRKLGIGIVSKLAEYFAIFAVLSSLMGVATSLFHFIMDGLKLPKTKLGNIKALLISFVPPLIGVYLYPAGLVDILGFAGIFVAIILGIIPTCAYININKLYQKLSCKSLIAYITLIFFCVVIILEAINLSN